jgi:hypothetical protein
LNAFEACVEILVGAVLERVREFLDSPAGGAGKQTTSYLREAPQTSRSLVISPTREAI